MPTSYEQADERTQRMARDVMERYHPELRFQGKDGLEYPRLCLLMAFADDGEPAVKCHGYPAAAVVSKINLKQRVDNRADAEIVIDKENWETLSEGQQLALLDHEITHLEIATDEKGQLKTDDIGRPKLKLRLHDFDFGGFRSIARRYGKDAPEVRLAKHFEEDFGQDVLRAGEPRLPFKLDKETLEGPAREFFGPDATVEDNEHGVTITTRMPGE